MAKVLCSTGALLGRPNGRDYRLLEKFKSEIECDGFEFMMYNSWYDKISDLLNFVLKLDVDFPVIHCEKFIGDFLGKGEIKTALKLFKINCEIANEICAEKMVLHLWNGPSNDTNFKNNLASLPYLLEISEKSDILLTVENVVCVKKDPLSRFYEMLEKYPATNFTYDTKMAAFHGQEKELYKKENRILWNKIKHFHINDYGGKILDWQNLITLPIGVGNIDFGDIFKFIKDINYNDTITFEATAFDKAGNVNIAVLNNCYKKIKTQLG